MRFAVGQRVRHTEGMTSLPEFPPEDAIPAGAVGTVDHVFTEHGEGYGVVFDCDPHHLSAYCKPDELEAAE